MSLKVVSKPSKDLLPIICTCQNCKNKTEASEYSDFKHGLLGSGMDNEQTDEIYIICPVCSDYAFPPEMKKQQLIAAYDLWKSQLKNKASKRKRK